MAYTVQVGDKNPKGVEALIVSAFEEIHQIYNNWNPQSEISRFNALPAFQPHTLSKELAAMLLAVDRLVHLTDGRFDPTVEPLARLWKASLCMGELPNLTESPRIGWHHIHFDGETVWKDQEGVAIDLGGIAKGWAVDQILERVENAGYDHLYVEWGGEIRVKGRHPSGRAWRVAILGGPSLELKNQAIATSGSYRQNWTIDGVSYTHIIDPRSKEPLQAPCIQSVSILAPTCMEADALATALMLFSSAKQAKSWADSYGFQVWLN